MFVNSNKEADLKKYFRSKLAEKYSESEMKFMFQELLQKRLGLTKEELMFAQDLRLSESDLLYFRTATQQLLEDKPFQYILGESFFCDLVLDCDARALIPRPETEELVNWLREDFKQHQNPEILDLCTGSGCIALAIKHYLPKAHVVGMDVSLPALDLAKQNALKTKLEVNFEYGDVLAEWQPALKEYDAWISNPPYIPMDEENEMHPNVLKHEPHLALFVPNADALLFYREIAQKAIKHLRKGAKIYFEIHENLAQQLSELLVSLGFENPEIKLDLQGKQRMIKAMKIERNG